MVHVGNVGAPPTHCSDDNGMPITNIEKTPAIVEKPYITYDPVTDTNDGDGWNIHIPALETDKVGPISDVKGIDVSFDRVYVAKQTDTAEAINLKLDSGLHLVLQPGQYHLKDTIVIKNADTVVMGLGMATLISESGKPCIQVTDVDGVKISSILLQASNMNTDALLKWGTDKLVPPF